MGDQIPELSLGAYTLSGDVQYSPDGTSGTNYFRQQDIFTKAKEKTTSTKEIEDVTVELTDNNADKRDLQAYDIAARPFNISGFKVMKDSPMYKKFIEINGDDFTIGLNNKGEQVMLFDKTKSDGKVKMFSAEETEDKRVYYAIKDENGNIWKYGEDCQLLQE